MCERLFEMLSKLTKDMQDAFPSHRSSELKRIVGIFNYVLLELCTKVLPTIVPTLAHEVIGQAGTADGKAFGYKITKDAFPSFRATFERRLKTRLVSFVEDQLVSRLADTAGPARDETIK